MTSTQLIWISKKYGPHFMSVFVSQLKQSGYKSKTRKAETFIENIIRENYATDSEKIDNCFTKAKSIARV